MLFTAQIRVMTRLKILLPENLEVMEHYIEQEKPKLVAIDALKSLSNTGPSVMSLARMSANGWTSYQLSSA